MYSLAYSFIPQTIVLCYKHPNKHKLTSGPKWLGSLKNWKTLWHMDDQLDNLWGQFVFLQKECKQTQRDWSAAMAAAQVSALPRLCVSFNREMQSLEGLKKAACTTFCSHWSLHNLPQMSLRCTSVWSHTEQNQQLRLSVHVPSLTVSSAGFELSSFLCFIAWSSFFSCRTSFRNSSLWNEKLGWAI